MEIVLYLAMTAAEFKKASHFPGPVAWMACHFSPYGTGLSNLPRQLPVGSLLILNDRTPIDRHDPALIARQLSDTVEQFQCDGILLDLQRPGAEAVAKAVSALPCPVAVTAPYARALDRAVFLPPPALNQPLEDHLAPWQGREIWLEAALERACFRITAEGNQQIDQPVFPCPHMDENLHCRYGMEVGQEWVDIHLHRDMEQLNALMREGQQLGISKFVGLYQQLGT